MSGLPVRERIGTKLHYSSMKFDLTSGLLTIDCYASIHNIEALFAKDTRLGQTKAI
jgi:hypothetical protein